MKFIINFFIFLCVIPLSIIETALIGIIGLFLLGVGSIFFTICIIVGMIFYFINSIKHDYTKVCFK